MNGSIVSVDSVQQYRGMDIGSAKVSYDIRQTIPHYCIDIASIQQPLNVSEFAHHAHGSIQHIIQSGRTPILVGGSGFYLRWLLHPPHGPLITPEIQTQSELLMSDTSSSWEVKLGRSSIGIKSEGREFLLNKFHNKEVTCTQAKMKHLIELVLAAGGGKPEQHRAPNIDDIRRQ